MGCSGYGISQAIARKRAHFRSRHAEVDGGRSLKSRRGKLVLEPSIAHNVPKPQASAGCEGRPLRPKQRVSVDHCRQPVAVVNETSRPVHNNNPTREVAALLQTAWPHLGYDVHVPPRETTTPRSGLQRLLKKTAWAISAKQTVSNQALPGELVRPGHCAFRDRSPTKRVQSDQMDQNREGYKPA